MNPQKDSDYYPPRVDQGDSSKPSPVSRTEYEEFVNENLEKLQKEIALDEDAVPALSVSDGKTLKEQEEDTLAEEAEESAAVGQEADEESEIYNDFL